MGGSKSTPTTAVVRIPCRCRAGHRTRAPWGGWNSERFGQVVQRSHLCEQDPLCHPLKDREQQIELSQPNAREGGFHCSRL